jgi:hypothetical protein
MQSKCALRIKVIMVSIRLSSASPLYTDNEHLSECRTNNIPSQYLDLLKQLMLCQVAYIVGAVTVDAGGTPSKLYGTKRWKESA